MTSGPAPQCCRAAFKAETMYSQGRPSLATVIYTSVVYGVHCSPPDTRTGVVVAVEVGVVVVVIVVVGVSVADVVGVELAWQV